MRTSHKNPSSARTRRSTKLGELLRRCLEAGRDARKALVAVRRRWVRHRGRGAAAGGAPNTRTVADLASLTERSEALAALCDRLIQELEGEDVKAGEIRFVVHKHQQTSYPRLDPETVADLSGAELVWELRRLIAWAGGTLADVAGTLETRAGDLGEAGRALLQDEVVAIDDDLILLKARLADRVDWDAELGHLLAGEVGPFDDPAAEQDDHSDE